MEIKLRDEDKKLVVTDEGFDSPLLWLKLEIRGADEELLAEIEVPHRELMASLIAFDAKHQRFDEEIEKA